MRAFRTAICVLLGVTAGIIWSLHFTGQHQEESSLHLLVTTALIVLAATARSEE